MLLRNLTQRHVSERAAPSFRRCHAAFRVLQTPCFRLPTRAPAMCIKNSCPLFSSGEQMFGTSPFHWRPRWNPKRPPGWASSSPPKLQRTVVSFCRHRDASVWRRCRGFSHFLHCGVGTIIIYSTSFQTPSDNAKSSRRLCAVNSWVMRAWWASILARLKLQQHHHHQMQQYTLALVFGPVEQQQQVVVMLLYSSSNSNSTTTRSSSSCRSVETSLPLAAATTTHASDDLVHQLPD